VANAASRTLSIGLLALALLGGVGVAAADRFDDLSEQALRGDRRERADAVQAIGDEGNSRGIQICGEVLARDKVVTVRVTAVLAVWKLARDASGSNLELATEILTRVKAKDRNPAVRRVAARVLVRLARKR
jgi:hypothetical protein